MATIASHRAIALGTVLAACGAEPQSPDDAKGDESSEATTAGSSEGGPTTSEPGDDSTSEGGDTSGAPAMPGCGDGIVDAGEACDDGNDDPNDGCLPDCTAIPLIDPPPLEWTYFEIEGTQCLDGSPAGFGVSWQPDSPNVMIYLEGGGACFNDACDFTAFSAPFAPPSDGIFDRDNDANAVADWTMIYVPYCTGDIHAGDAEAELGGKMRQFRGYGNITRYLQTWVPTFAETETVLLTGISAGGFGAALNAMQVANAWGDDVQLVVVDDSGPPLSSDVIPPCLQQTFRQTWNLDATALAACPDCDPNDFATDLFDELVTSYPDVRLGLFSNTADLVIRTYMGFGWGNGQYDDCTGFATPVPMDTYNNDLIAMRAVYEDVSSTFYVNGLGHTALRSGYGTTSVEGTSLADWVAQVIAGEHVHVGP